MEPVRKVCAGGVVLNSRGEVALVVSGPLSEQFWGFPKGHVDPGEDVRTSAVREIAEETGLDALTFVHELGMYERYKAGQNGGDDTSELKEIHMFLFSTEEEVLAPRDEWNPEAAWVPLDMVSARLTHPLDRVFFEKIVPILRQ